MLGGPMHSEQNLAKTRSTQFWTRTACHEWYVTRAHTPPSPFPATGVESFGRRRAVAGLFLVKSLEESAGGARGYYPLARLVVSLSLIG